MKKRILALCLAALMILALLPTFALAVEEFEIKDGVLVRYNGPGGNVVIPEGVKEIGRSAVTGSKITGITIPSSVTKIDRSAFQFTSITSLTVPGSVTEIGEEAFNGCSELTRVTLSPGVSVIGSAAFQSCGALSSLSLPNTLTQIGDRAFMHCKGLTSVTIPGSVVRIGTSAFSFCSGLTSITLSDGIREIGGFAFSHCNAATLTVPGSVTKMDEYAFSDLDGMTTLTLNEGITTIGAKAFSSNKKLSEVNLPSTLTSIGEEAFGLCSGLHDITIPSSVTQIGDGAFVGYYKGGLTIHGVAGSQAQTFANKNGIGFKAVTEAPRIAYASTQYVTVDGKSVKFEMYALKDANNNDTNYVKVRDVAYVLNGSSAQFDVGWNGKVNLEAGKAYKPNNTEMFTPFSGNRAYTSISGGTNVNGAPASLSAILLQDDSGGGYTYYKLRDLGNALGFTVGWSAEQGVYITTH